MGAAAVNNAKELFPDAARPMRDREFWSSRYWGQCPQANELPTWSVFCGLFIMLAVAGVVLWLCLTMSAEGWWWVVGALGGAVAIGCAILAAALGWIGWDYTHPQRDYWR